MFKLFGIVFTATILVTCNWASTCSYPKTLIISRSDDLTIKIWDFQQNGRCIITLEDMNSKFKKTLEMDIKLSSESDDNTELVYSLSYLDNNNSLVNEIKVWNLRTMELKRTISISHYDFMQTFDINLNRTLIATGSDDQTVKIWSFINGSLVKVFTVNFAVSSLKFSTDGNFLAIAEGSNQFSTQGNFAIYDIAKGQFKIRRNVHTCGIKDFVIVGSMSYFILISKCKANFDVLVLNPELSSIQNVRLVHPNNSTIDLEPDNIVLKHGFLSVLIAGGGIIHWYNFNNGELSLRQSRLPNSDQYFTAADVNYYLNKLVIGEEKSNITFIDFTNVVNNMKLTGGHLGRIRNLFFWQGCLVCQLVGTLDCSSCYADIENCDKCEQGLVYNNTLRICSSDISYCKTCISKGGKPVCLSCKGGIQLQENQCSACNYIAGCLQCPNSTICNLCSGNSYITYFRNMTTGNCSSCQETNVEYIDENKNESNGTGYCLLKSECTLKNCQKCKNLYKNCSECLPGMLLKEPSDGGSDECSDCTEKGYMNFTYDGKNGSKISICKRCPEGCEDCSYDSIESLTKCKKCIPGFILQGGICIMSCSLKDCVACDKNNCSQCVNNYYLQFNKTTKIFSCTSCQAASKEYIDENFPYTNGTGICLNQDECQIGNCRRCKNNYIECSICENGFFFEDSEVQNAKCVKCNSPGLYTKDNRCLKCGIKCKSCLSSDSCEICQEGSFIQNKICFSCLSNCSKCSSFDNCTICQEGYFLYSSNPKGKVYDKCLQSCENKEGLLYDSAKGVCKSCDTVIENCKICSSMSGCSKCEDGYFLKSSSEPGVYNMCVQECSKANSVRVDIVSGSQICEKCGTNKQDVLLAPRFEVCAKCDDLIKGCSECTSTNRCEVCQSNHFLSLNICLPRCSGQFPILDLNQKKCVSECQIGFFESYDEVLNVNVCQECKEECEQCLDKSTCTSCKLGYVIQNNSCGKTCLNGEFPNWVLKICSPCKYEEFSIISDAGITCGKCSYPCKSCLLSPTKCTSCISGLFWNNSTCSSDCNDGFYPMVEYGLCDRCHSNCSTCIDKGPKSCTSCYEPLFLFKGECLELCPPSYFGNIQKRSCDFCHYSCLNCLNESSTACIDCPNSRVLKAGNNSLLLNETSMSNFSNATNVTGECQCMKGYFDIQDRFCGECHFSCEDCRGSSMLECLKCAGNRGNEDRSTRGGRCLCPANMYDYLEPICKDSAGESITISLVKAQKSSVTYTTVSSIVGFGFLRIFGSLFNFIEIAQEINFYSLIGINYPLNLEELLDFLSHFRFYKNFKFFQYEKINNLTEDSNITNGRTNLFLRKGISQYFLKNSLSTLLILFIVPLLLFVTLKSMEIYLRKRELNEPLLKEKVSFKGNYLVYIIKEIWSKRRVILLGVVFTLFLGSLQEMQLFVVLQIISWEFDTLLQKINVISSIIWLILEILFLIYVAKSFLVANPEMIRLMKQKAFLLKKLRKKQHDAQEGAMIKTTLYNILSIEEKKNSYPFLYGSFLKEDIKGMSYIFYRILKKILIPTMYAIYSEDDSSAMFYLILIYIASFMYLRIVQPFQQTASNILAELTELGQLNFFFLLKFYTKAVNSRNKEVGLTLGIYMIYSVIFLIIINTLFLIVTLVLSFSKKVYHFQSKTRKIVKKKSGRSVSKNINSDVEMAKQGSSCNPKDENPTLTKDNEISFVIQKLPKDEENCSSNLIENQNGKKSINMSLGEQKRITSTSDNSKNIRKLSNVLKNKPTQEAKPFEKEETNFADNTNNESERNPLIPIGNPKIPEIECNLSEDRKGAQNLDKIQDNENPIKQQDLNKRDQELLNELQVIKEQIYQMQRLQILMHQHISPPFHNIDNEEYKEGYEDKKKIDSANKEPDEINFPYSELEQEIKSINVLPQNIKYLPPNINEVITQKDYMEHFITHRVNTSKHQSCLKMQAHRGSSSIPGSKIDDQNQYIEDLVSHIASYEERIKKVN